MAAKGVPAGLCGEGADSLFGVGLASAIHEAEFARRWLPSSGIRAAAAGLCRTAGMERVAGALQLANRLHDFTDLEHPVNQSASFADWEATRACFGLPRSPTRPPSAEHCSTGWPCRRRRKIACMGLAFLARRWTAHRSGPRCLITPVRTFYVRFSIHGCCTSRSTYRRPCVIRSVSRRNCSNERSERMAPREVARRRKLGFGQPIFEWLSPGGQFRHWSSARHPRLHST